MTKRREIKSLNWAEGYNFSVKIQLGTDGLEYIFEAVWNTRDESFEATILTWNKEAIISGRKMVLGFDLLGRCYSPFKPDCMLIPMTSDLQLERITYEAMNNNKVKLYHLIQKEID